MTGAALDAAVRDAGARIRAALAARFRDLDLAEDSFAEACARAVARWRETGVPDAPAAWLWRVAERCALDAIRARRRQVRLVAEEWSDYGAPQELDDAVIPDERLRLIFVCCHPAVAAEARAALTLRLVCGLSSEEIARAFLLPLATLQQRLVRAKRKIAGAGVAFEIPPPAAWPERLDAVLSTLEVAYSRAHADAAGSGPHAGFAGEMLALSGLLATLVAGEADVLAVAATLRFAEARRPARVDALGVMVPVSEQDPALWHGDLIAEGSRCLARAIALGRPGARVLQAAIHEAWCSRKARADAAPWPAILALYDRLLQLRDDPVVRLNRAVALAEVAGPTAALAVVDGLAGVVPADFLPWHAVRADLLRRVGRRVEAGAAYDAALGLGPGLAEAGWLKGRKEALLF